MLPDAREPPRGRRFYAIQDNEDGTVDVYLMPEVSVYPIPDGFKEYDVRVRVVRGIVPTENLESDIRARFMAWCESAEVVDL